MYNRICITMGDPSGIGPEIILSFFDKIYKFEEKKVFIAVIGSKSILEHYIKKFNYDIKIKELDEYTKIQNMYIENGVLPLINIDFDINNIKIGTVNKLSGEYCIKYLNKALELCNSKYFDAMVTAPISKDSINLAGYKYSGHTSYLADKTKTTNFGMVLKGNKITVILNTTHLSMMDAIKKVKKESVLEKIILAKKAKEELGIKGKIAVAGLNPHNGENGLFGNEEETEIIPAIKEAQKIGIDVEGPIVPDTLFVKMLKDFYNIAVVMYHDQGLIPMKMESFGKGVNVTIGLPIIRTSVDHGTAFDIAGKGKADDGSLCEAVKIANTMIKNKKENIELLAEKDYSN